MIEPESQDAISLRRKVVLAFWAVFLFLGIPLWFKTTTIHRTPLPLKELSYIEDRLEHDLGLQAGVNGIYICANVQPSCLSTSSLDQISAELSTLSPPSIFNIDLVTGTECRYTVDCTVSTRQKSKSVRITKTEQIKIEVPSGSAITPQLVAHGVYDAFLGDILFFNKHELGAKSDFISAGESSTLHAGAAYADKLHLSFTFLIAIDSTQYTRSLMPEMHEQWRNGVESLILDLQESDLNTFVSSITYDSDIGFQYVSADSTEHSQLGEEVSSDQLSSLLDTWDLQHITLVASNQTEPTPRVLQFVYYLPPVQSPRTRSLGFTVANWGGVVIAGRDATITSAIKSFRKQLVKLISPVSFTLRTESGTKRVLPHQHEFARIATITNLRAASENAAALTRIITSLPEMAVPSTVRDLVVRALEEWNAPVATLTGKLDRLIERSVLQHAATAAFLVNKAAFDKNMMLNIFVPFEHKVAVYLPLLGPVFVPLAVGLRRIVKEWR
ncbi:phosphatidylinositol-glycan biosynthesis class S protein [Lipomyces arxii]|uniref:phosphatidylinositol-glycan biosynthesis class S protein n=1 Tax=Lipomyces arxii TaxID=56418 RepID=UPI0034CF43AB